MLPFATSLASDRPTNPYPVGRTQRSTNRRPRAQELIAHNRGEDAIPNADTSRPAAARGFRSRYVAGGQPEARTIGSVAQTDTTLTVRPGAVSTYLQNQENTIEEPPAYETSTIL